jgi:4'-phosphopantetheinyl transferase
LTVTWEPGPPTPPGPRSEAHVWRADLDESIWPGEEKLPAADRSRAGAFLRPEPRRRWVSSRWALRLTIASYLGEDAAAIELETTANGKPRLSGGGPLRFNLSHSDSLALIAVTWEREIGVDIERVERERDFEALARRGLEPSAAEAVRRAPAAERARAFYAAWVRREAVAKCIGAGLGRPAPTRPIAVSPLEVGPDWAAALALAGVGAVPVRCFELRASAARR